MILCFQCEDLSKIFLGSKFEMHRPIITFCAIWHYRDLKGYLKFGLHSLTYLGLLCVQYLHTQATS